MGLNCFFHHGCTDGGSTFIANYECIINVIGKIGFVIGVIAVVVLLGFLYIHLNSLKYGKVKPARKVKK